MLVKAANPANPDAHAFSSNPGQHRRPPLLGQVGSSRRTLCAGQDTAPGRPPQLATDARPCGLALGWGAHRDEGALGTHRALTMKGVAQAGWAGCAGYSRAGSLLLRLAEGRRWPHIQNQIDRQLRALLSYQRAYRRGHSMGCTWSLGRTPVTCDFQLANDHLPRPASDRPLS